MKTICRMFFFAFAVAIPIAVSAQIPLPPFLPDHYGPVFESLGGSWQLVRQSETNGQFGSVYESPTLSSTLLVENIPSERATAQPLFANIVTRLNQLIASNKGSFVEINETDLQANVILPSYVQSVLVFSLPRSIQIWTFSTTIKNSRTFNLLPQAIRRQVNRQRYEEAIQSGNISMGYWNNSIREHAMTLLGDGDTAQALSVLKVLLESAPGDFEAHLALMTHTPDAVAASNSAKAVFRNSEDLDQIDQAARFLGKERMNLDELPTLSPDDTGLRLVLIPLPPCNPWFLEESAKVFEQITQIPVSIRRLDVEWKWKTPERIAFQRDVQMFLTSGNPTPFDFTGWPPERYFSEIRKLANSKGPIFQWSAEKWIQRINASPGQYAASYYLVHLNTLLRSRRSGDHRTAYVGLTEANLFSGDSNFVFSQALPGVSILSYHMMLGSTFGEQTATRRRLVERIAKSLTSTGMLQLGLTRSTDPSCPTSYPNGIQRLDQQTLILSDEIERQLDRLRNPTAPNADSSP